MTSSTRTDKHTESKKSKRLKISTIIFTVSTLLNLQITSNVSTVGHTVDVSLKYISPKTATRARQAVNLI